MGEILSDPAYRTMLESQRQEILDRMEVIDMTFASSPLVWNWTRMQKFNSDIHEIMKKVLDYQSHVLELLQSNMPDDDENK